MKDNGIKIWFDRFEWEIKGLESNLCLILGSINETILELEGEMRKRIVNFMHERSINPEEMKTLLKNKADKSEIVSMNTIKADKFELNEFNQGNRLTQKQMVHVWIILIEFLKIQIKTNEKSYFNNQNKYLLKQALTVFNWMKSAGVSHSEQLSDSSLSPRLNDESMHDQSVDASNAPGISVQPFTPKMEPYFKGTQSKSTEHPTHRSVSTKHTMKNKSILDSLKVGKILT